MISIHIFTTNRHRKITTNDKFFIICQSFIKKIANWKLNNGEVEEETTASSLMTEYMDTYHSTYKRGNLYLNILGCSATYFSWNVDQAYKALLPIPQSALDVNENLTQNPGY